MCLFSQNSLSKSQATNLKKQQRDALKNHDVTTLSIQSKQIHHHKQLIDNLLQNYKPSSILTDI